MSFRFLAVLEKKELEGGPVRHRITWLEVARVLMTLVVVLEHMPYGTSFNFNNVVFLWSPIFFFFFVSGYLAGRTGYKEGQWFNWQRARNLGMVFLVWQILPYFFVLCTGRAYNGVVIRDAAWIEQAYYFFLMPVNTPLWFLRELIIWSFLSPLLLRLRWGLLMLGASVIILENIKGSCRWLPPGIVGFYWVGLALSAVSWERLRSRVRQMAPASIILMLVFMVWIAVLGVERHLNSTFLGLFYGHSYGVIPSLIGVLAALGIGVWIEDLFPKLADRVAMWGPSTLLVYVGHFPLIGFLGALLSTGPAKQIPAWGYVGYGLTTVVAILIFALFHLLYLGIVRFMPWSLPLLMGRQAPSR